jgi:hypothetical protein
MHEDEQKALIEGWLTISNWMAAVIIAAVTVAITVVILRVLGKRTFTIFEITLPLSRFWMVALVLSVAHGYLAWSFIRASELVAALPDATRNTAWRSLTTGNNLLFNGMEPRLNTATFVVGKISIPLYQIRLEPASLLQLGCALAMMAALVSPPYKASWSLINRVFLAFCFVVLNWICGSAWVSAASAIPVRMSPNQAMQRTASKLAAGVPRFCHPQFGSGPRCTGLAVADVLYR